MADKPSKARRLFLVLALILFAAWVGWLSYQLATTGRPIVVSRPQIVMSPLVIEAELKAADNRPAAEVHVTKVYRGQDLLGIPPDAPLPKHLKLSIANMQHAQGWRGPGEYILPLRKLDDAPPRFEIVRIPISPLFHPPPDSELRKPPIYPANDSTRAQLLDSLR